MSYNGGLQTWCFQWWGFVSDAKSKSLRQFLKLLLLGNSFLTDFDLTYKARFDCNSIVMMHVVKIAELGSKKDYEKIIVKRIYVSLLSLLYYTILYSSVNDGLNLKS